MLPKTFNCYVSSLSTCEMRMHSWTRKKSDHVNNFVFIVIDNPCTSTFIHIKKEKKSTHRHGHTHHTIYV